MLGVGKPYEGERYVPDPENQPLARVRQDRQCDERGPRTPRNSSMHGL